MASSAELMQPLPDTLPEDFSEWDNGFSAAARPVDFNASQAAALGRPATRPSSHSPSSRSEAPPYTASALDGSHDLPRYTAGSFNEQDEFLLRSFRFKEAVEITPKRSTRKRTVAIVIAIVPILLLLAFFPGVYSGLRFNLARVKQSIATPSQ